MRLAANNDAVSGIVLGINVATFEVAVSIRRYESIQDRKHVQKYLRPAPRPTLGDLLSPESE